VTATKPVTVLYDEDCGFCKWSTSKMLAWDRIGRDRQPHLRAASITSEEGALLLASIDPDQRLRSAHAVTSDGRIASAGAMLPVVFRELPLAWPLAALASLSPKLTDRAYFWVVARRFTFGRWLGQDACSVDPSAISRSEI